MTRYFFNIIDGQFIVDGEGALCASVADMRQLAIRTAGAMLEDMAGHFPAGVEWQMHVTNESRETVLKLCFSAEEPNRARPVPAA